MNVFDKPSAEPNLFRLCRGGKTTVEDKRFDKPSAELNLFGRCCGGKRTLKTTNEIQPFRQAEGRAELVRAVPRREMD